MKSNKKNELDVDFIGGQEPLTKEEERAISDYINARKKGAAKASATRKSLAMKRKRSLA